MLIWQGINYNIANGQKLDRTRIGMVVLLLVVFSGLFIYLALDRFMTNREKFEQEIIKLNAYKERIDILSDQAKDYKDRIDRLKKQWGSRVKFANSLVSQKTYSYIKILDLLETLLPAGVFIEDISLKNGQDTPVNFTLKADSYDILLRTYGKISHKFDLTITKEIESGGLFTARLRVSNKK